jgi:hypothetical protein
MTMSHPLLKSKGCRSKPSAKKNMMKAPHNTKVKKMDIPNPSSEEDPLNMTKKKMRACLRVSKDLRTPECLRKGWSKSNRILKTRKIPTIHRTTFLT